MFYENLCRLLDKEGISQSRFAKEIGLNPSSASDWGKGAVPRMSTLRKIADYFGVSVEELTKDSSADKKEEQSVEIAALFDSLSASSKEQAKAYLEFLLQKEGKKDEK